MLQKRMWHPFQDIVITKEVLINVRRWKLVDVRKGLLSTESVSHKCLRVYLTDKSREMKPKVMEVAQKRHNALADLTTPEDLEVFTRIIDKIITLI